MTALTPQSTGRRGAATAGSRGSHRRPDIQGLRALAVLSVVAYHAGLPVPGGFIGVDVFFVISGFVITAMLHREWLATGRIRFGSFYVRRFRRLTPALAVMVAVTVVASVFVLSPLGTQQSTALTGLGAMLLLANVAVVHTTGGYFDDPAATNALLHTWSLSVEEQFYLGFPLILFLGWVIARRGRRSAYAPLVLVAVVAVASFGLALLNATGYSLPSVPSLIDFYSPLTRAWEFAAGGLLALLAHGARRRSARLATAAGLAGIGLLAVALWTISAATPFPGAWTLLPVAATMLLLYAGGQQTNPVSDALSTRPMVWIGDLSYSIYLWHWPFIVLAALRWPGQVWLPVVAALVSLVPAVASYRFVEEPIRGRTPLPRPRLAALVAVTVLPPVLLTVGLWRAADAWYWRGSLQAAVAESETLPTGFERPPCASQTPVDERDVAQCQWGVGRPGAPLYLVGDSNAMHFSDGVIAAAEELDRPLTALANAGCPLIDAYVYRRSDPGLMTQCRESYVALMAWLLAQPPGLVLVGSVDRYWDDKDDYLITRDGDLDRANPRMNDERLDEGLKKTVGRLKAAGHTVVLVQTIPHFIYEPHTMPLAACTGWTAITGSCNQEPGEMPRWFADANQAESRLGIVAVAKATGAAVLDLRDFFCRGRACSTRRDGIDLYLSDGYHLNRAGSASLGPRFAHEIGHLSAG